MTARKPTAGNLPCRHGFPGLPYDRDKTGKLLAGAGLAAEILLVRTAFVYENGQVVPGWRPARRIRLGRPAAAPGSAAVQEPDRPAPATVPTNGPTTRARRHPGVARSNPKASNALD